jgi:hypothetical protein
MTAKNNNTKGMQKAAKQFSDVAAKAKSDETEDLQKAESVLQEVMQDAPPEAQEGLSKALENVRAAKNRSDKEIKPSKPGDRAPVQNGSGGTEVPENVSPESSTDRQQNEGNTRQNTS